MAGLGNLIKTYSELITLPTFEERVRYLQLKGALPSMETFGDARWVNQILYRSYEWNKVRRDVIIRDNGNELAMDGRPIEGKIIVHHIDPLRYEDFELKSRKIFDPENLICMSFDMHNFIHYGKGKYYERLEAWEPRKQYDTCPWR